MVLQAVDEEGARLHRHWAEFFSSTRPPGTPPVLFHDEVGSLSRLGEDRSLMRGMEVCWKIPLSTLGPALLSLCQP